ncbi:MAG: ABC transporter, partial [Planctomycetaceae bacterium]|nr:ABC transporter [Planctomycetaceae bacterium]
LVFHNQEIPQNLEKYGTILEAELPTVKINVQREKVSESLAAILSQYQVEDVTVNDCPLEDVFAELFEDQKKQAQS